MARKSRQNKRSEAAIASSKAIRGLERAAHFAAGGTLEQWRGRHSVVADPKKVASKRACRGRVRDW